MTSDDAWIINRGLGNSRAFDLALPRGRCETILFDRSSQICADSLARLAVMSWLALAHLAVLA